MRIQTILNRVEKFKSFVYGRVSLENRMDGFTLVIRVKPRKNSRVFCSSCGRPGPVYDHLTERRFEFIPVWGILGSPQEIFYHRSGWMMTLHFGSNADRSRRAAIGLKIPVRCGRRSHRCGPADGRQGRRHATSSSWPISVRSQPRSTVCRSSGSPRCPSTVR